MSHPQKDNHIAAWRPLALFCASNIDTPGLLEKIRAINSSKEEVFRPSSLREKGLIMTDWAEFGLWLTQESNLSTARINKKLGQLYHWRWAYWHVHGAPVEMIPAPKRMSLTPWYADYLVIFHRHQRDS